MTNTLKIAIILLVAVGFTFAADYELRVNTALAKSDPIYKGLHEFQKNVEKRSNGQLKIKLFSGSALGKDEDVLEQARAGAPVAVLVDGGRLAVFVKEFGILGAPYLSTSYKEMSKIVTSDMFDGWVKKLAKKSGHQVLSFNWFQGFRNMLTNKAIAQPSDLNGIRVRTPGAPVWMETVRAMGATPTPMGWTEVYSAMQQKAIDGVEAQSPAVVGSKLYEVISHLTKTGHINLITGLVTSAQWFETLPANLQVILKEESLKAGNGASLATERSLLKFEEIMKFKGMTINDVDKTPFIEATKGVYDKLGYGELRKKINAILKK